MAEKGKRSLALFEGIVGADRVSDDPVVLAEYLDAGKGTPEEGAWCRVKPGTGDELQEVVKSARREGLNLVPVSSGPPHLRGGAAPDGEGVIVDLGGMDRIVRVDRRNKVAMVEPGVTFGRLKDAVGEEGLKVLMPLLPRANKSVLSCFLEREPILVPKHHWDMTDPMLCTEVVFGTGDVFRTGSAAGPGSLEEQWGAGMAQTLPMGPAQTDFVRLLQAAQGSMGIVTWASVRLGLMPSIRRLYFIAHQSLDKLIDLAYRTLRLRLGEEFFILNSFNLAAALGKEAGEIEGLAGRQAPWTAILCAAGYEYFPRERLDAQQGEIRSIARRLGLEVQGRVPGATSGEMMRLIDNPCEEPYWKLRYRGGCREIFFITTLDRVPAMLEIMRGEMDDKGYPGDRLGVYIQPIQHGRNCHCEFDLPYAPGDAGEVEKVEKLFLDASARLLQAGAFFSRPYGAWAELAYARCPDTVAALRKVKRIVDPDGIMNRGKLCFEGGGGNGTG